MGKDRRHRPKKNFAEKRREKQKKKDEWDKTPQRSYADIVRENKDFETYYQTQNIVPGDEWNAFMNTMRENLPVAFRITGSKVETKALLKIIEGDLFKEILNSKLEESDSKEVKPRCLPFYPERLGWQLQLTRTDIRRSEAFFRLHNFLIAETNSGNISRQEVVSMVPPLVLDVKPWHKVLDMCAAPGSKTAQLIEMINTDEKTSHPDGFVIANDLDNNRCYMLVHQAKRLNSPNILITNHDSSVMPNFITTKSDGSEDILKFDRILADVPCSGDGTMRKNPDIWCKWSPANGNNLHGIQYRIAKRGVELLAIGGKMVYSTCSLNPVENEGVLHRLLSETGDSVQLIDCRNLVPGLVYNPGVTHWKPASKNLMFFDRWEDVPEQLQTQIRPKMFPPAPEEAAKFHLDRCLRILPHHQDTGGFFVAVLEKLKQLPWESDFKVGSNSIIMNPEQSNLEENSDVKIDDRKRIPEDGKQPWGPQRKRKRIQGYREDPFVFFKAIRDIVKCNEDKVKMINTGVKTFVRCDNKNMTCAFRLAQEGLNSIVSFIGDCRKLEICKEDLITLLQNNDHHTPPEIKKLNPVTQEKLKDFAKGSCVLVYTEENASDPSPLKLEMVGWRGIMSLRAYVSLHDAIHYLRLLGADYSMFDKNKFQVNRDAVASKNENNDNNVDNCPTLNNDRSEKGEKKHNDSYLSKDMSEIIE